MLISMSVHVYATCHSLHTDDYARICVREQHANVEPDMMTSKETHGSEANLRGMCPSPFSCLGQHIPKRCPTT